MTARLTLRCPNSAGLLPAAAGIHRCPWCVETHAGRCLFDSGERSGMAERCR